jgi:hypothetical protein
MFTAGLILAALGIPLNWYVFARLMAPREQVHGRIAQFWPRQAPIRYFIPSGHTHLPRLRGLYNIGKLFGSALDAALHHKHG